MNRLYEQSLLVLLSVSAILIAFMALSVSLDVAIRNFDRGSIHILGLALSWNLGWKSLPWVLEISEYILFGSTFLAAPWVLRHGGHVRVDVVVRALGTRTQRVVNRAADGVGLVVCVFLVVYGFRTAIEAYHLNSLIFKQFVIPEWWLLPLIPFPSLLLTIEFLFRLAGAREQEQDDNAGLPVAKDIPRISDGF